MKRTLLAAAALTALFTTLDTADAGRRGGFSRRTSNVSRSSNFRRNTGIQRNTNIHRTSTVRRNTTINTRRSDDRKTILPVHKHFTGKKVIHLHPKHVHHYHLKYGKKFKHGYYYFGKLHHHWTKKVWFAKFGCYGHWCPHTSAYYYWHAQHGCYYPMSYRPTGVFAY